MHICQAAEQLENVLQAKTARKFLDMHPCEKYPTKMYAHLSTFTPPFLSFSFF